MTKPYVYKCVNRNTQEFYFGYRSQNKCAAELDLGVKYFTSSKRVKPIFDQFNYEILKIFDTKEEAHAYEQSLIKEFWNDPLILNKSLWPKIKSCGSEKQKQSARNRMLSDKNPAKRPEQREAQRQRMLGSKASLETKAKMSLTRKGRKVPNSSKPGELNPAAKHYVFVSPSGETFNVIGARKKFCKEHNLGLDSMIKVIKGILPSYKGWTAWKFNQ